MPTSGLASGHASLRLDDAQNLIDQGLAVVRAARMHNGEAWVLCEFVDQARAVAKADEADPLEMAA